MNHKKVLLASMLAVSSFAAQFAHAVNWVGTADYTVAGGGDEEIVGPFSTYDAGMGVVLLQAVTGAPAGFTNFNGFYQSYVTNHEYLGNPVVSGLNTTYELTAVSSFTETLNLSTGAFTITGGTFNLFLDTSSATTRSFTGDSGFTDGISILSGTITGGTGTSVNAGGWVLGVADIDIQITGFNASVFEPDTITDAGGIFTLRLNNVYDSDFLNGINNVQGNSVVGGDKYSADGYITLAVPEAETYAMMLAGLGLVGFMARRRSRMPA